MYVNEIIEVVGDRFLGATGGTPSPSALETACARDLLQLWGERH